MTRQTKIGLPEMRVHDLRHAYAMLALQNGDDGKTVQTLLGHKTPDFTLNVYAYTPDAAKKDSASTIVVILADVKAVAVRLTAVVEGIEIGNR